MTLCVACGGEVPFVEFGGGIVVSMDGDFVCDERCKRLYNSQLNYLCKNILPSEEKTADYLLGRIDLPGEIRRKPE